MRRSLPLLFIFSLASSLPAQQSKPPAFRITGQVLDARNDSPVRRGHVAASLVTAARNGFREPVRTDTDETGRFLLELPSAGNWQINVSAHNIRPQNFEDHEGFFSGVVLTPTAPAYDMVFHAVPDAILTGTVTDEAGEPVRNAQVALFAIDKTAQQTGNQPLQQKQGTQTDDRGHYELASLEAGAYLVQVQARPWYAGNLGLPRTIANDTAVLPPDPSLDVVYPATWYPSGSDIAGAETLTAHPGDSLQADVRLVPVPSAHLIIPSTAPPAGSQSPNSDRPALNGKVNDSPQPFRGNPTVSLLLPNGTTQPVFGQFSTRNSRGDIEIGGLVPGTYQLIVPGGPDSPPRTTTIQLSAGGTLTDLGGVQQATPVTISVDGESKVRASQVVLRSTLTGQAFPDFNRQDFSDRPQRPGEVSFDQRSRPPIPQRGAQTNSRGRPGGQASSPSGRNRGRSPSDGDDATMQIPPGQYEVTLAGNSNAFLTGVAAKGASVVGRVVTITELPAHLMVHLGAGFATVQGTASIEGKPSVGAMVLLVPATMGDPTSFTVVHRDQTNTDGSFRMENIMPGPYILVAIDHGWSVRWTDPDTLRPYLMRGIPLELHSATAVAPKLIAIAP